MKNIKTAIMQPYFFPSLSYFKLINSVDNFIFLDDVSFIKKGWINRNKILMNGDSLLINVKCNSLSQNRKINEIHILNSERDRLKILQSLTHAYKKAPYFNDIFPILEAAIFFDSNLLSEYSSNTILQTLGYLGIKKNIGYSSKNFSDSEHLKGQSRIIEICKKLDSKIYINPEGGKNLYSKEVFENEKLNLKFLKSDFPIYNQFDNKFTPMLSIIDTLMFQNKDEVRGFLDEYSLN